MGSTSVDSANPGSEIFWGEKFQKFQKAELEFVLWWPTIYIAFTAVSIAVTLY